MREYSVNITELLNAIQKKDFNFFSLLTDEQINTFVPHLIMRWLTGSNNVNRICSFNALLNVIVPGPGLSSRHYIKAKDNELLFYQLMVIAMDGKKIYNPNWISVKSKSKTTEKLSKKVICDYFKYSSREADEYLPLLDQETIISFAEQLGWQKEELSKLEKELLLSKS